MAAGEVFTTREGTMKVPFRWNDGLHRALAYEPLQNYGWRERPDGSREPVSWEGHQWEFTWRLDL